jgi:competence ComEA-like helix-hairpin-helix protein
MFTRDERRAFLFLVTVAAVGGAVQLLVPERSAPGEPLTAQLAPGDIRRQAVLAARAESLARPLMPGERVDLDRAGVDEIERLPRVGPQLARRIADDRDSRGPFGSLEGLDRVPGVGPGMIDALGPWVEFSGIARVEPTAGRPNGQTASESPSASGSRCAGRPANPPSGRINLNRATAFELGCLPGIGPVLAARIVADRAEHGPFPQVQSLERVPGIGKARVRRLESLLTAP